MEKSNAEIILTETYERNGWPSLARPDLKPPEGWNLPLIAGVNRVRNHSLSPDGKTIAFVWDRDDQSDLYLLNVMGGWPRRLTAERAATRYYADSAPQWSPDGEWLAFEMNDHVYVMPAAGGLPQKISDFTDSASSPVWLPDSYQLIVSVERNERMQLLLTDREGCWPRALVTGPGDAWDAQVSPDGQWVAYVHRPFDDLNRLDICVVAVASGQLRTLVGSPKEINQEPRWSPDGAWLAFTAQRSGFFEIWQIRPDGEGLHQVTHLGHDCSDLAWSPDGTRLAHVVNRGGAFDLVLTTLQGAGSGSQTIDLHSGQRFHMRPRWLPCGTGLTVEIEDALQPPDLYRVDLTTHEANQLTFSNPPALAAMQLVNPEVVSYNSFDGLEIPSFLFRPQKPNGAAILYPHGGPSSQYVFEWDIFAQYLVAKGYTILAPNYRGSTGYGRAFEQANFNDWGSGDSQDCLFGAKYLASLPGVDPQRIASYGASYGGYMTVCGLARDPSYLFACGVNKFGDANLVSSWAQCNRDLRLYSEIFLSHPAHNWETYRKGSPIYQVDQIQKPMLILHGLDDTVVPPQASEELVEALRQHGKTYEYKTYAGEAHGFLKRANQLDVYSRIERFLDWHLLPNTSQP